MAGRGRETGMRSLARRTVPVAAALLAGAAVIAGAFAAHALAGVDERAAQLVETASRYQLAHALAVLVAGALRPERLAARAAWLAGILLFCGSLFARAAGLPRGLAMLAPVGGALFVLGWVILAVDLLRAGRLSPGADGPGHLRSGADGRPPPR